MNIEDPTEYIENLQKQIDATQDQNQQLASATNSMFNANSDPNIVEWQLELDNILERIEHLLKGDIVKRDDAGNEYWDTPTEDGLRPMNDYGVQYIMQILSFYINRNTILSNYEDKRINSILLKFGQEIAEQIENNYIKMGIDNQEKINRIPFIIMALTHAVESCYRRAWGGEERETLRKGTVVTQNLNPQREYQQQMVQPPKRSKFNPVNWFG